MVFIAHCFFCYIRYAKKNKTRIILKKNKKIKIELKKIKITKLNNSAEQYAKGGGTDRYNSDGCDSEIQPCYPLLIYKSIDCYKL
ncbi:hypothetical protein AWE51_07660 [Aquimarina aggregata]|uniref:Uncharacterized protein n=1 Tax=Aquimarina aggregata TaxID=1642818 RepID=A0A163AUL9_9FLAO|nr:hypothetical protein AWE51_07660 [Aquimarina aggregata]